ncbi:MAG: tetratricopeptide repeat protein [Candidatus Eisenbacteria bacterium]|nr:tetratricopeptide repeat protein [Candidatus Eisenbacteria bacterium]
MLPAFLTLSLVTLSLITATLLSSLAASEAHAAKRNYSYEEDPIRLGMKALDEQQFDVARAKFAEAIENEYQVYRAKYGQAEIAVREGRFEDAEPLYREALAGRVAETKSADYPEAHAGLGLLLLRFGRDDEAKLEFEQALKEKSGLWEAVYGQARLLLRAQKWDDAKRMLQKGSNRKGLVEGEDRYHYGMAVASQGKGDLPAAEKSALLALTLNPGEPEYGTLVAQIYDLRNAPTLAIDAYTKALATPGVKETAMVRHALGVLYEKTQRYNEARDEYARAVELDSTFAPGWKDLGELYGLAKQYDKSAGAYIRYVTLRGNQLGREDLNALVGLAEACVRVRNYAQGLVAAKSAYGLDSTDVAVRLAYARAGIQSKDKADKGKAAWLFSTFSDSLKTAKFEAMDFVNVARYQNDDLKLPLEAEKNLRQAIVMDSTLADAHLTFGMVKLSQQKPDSAVVHLRNATRLQPGSSLGWLNLGVALLQNKQPRDACAPLRRAAQINPAFTNGKVILGQALANADSLDAAVKVYQEVIDAEPTNAKALRGIGFIRLKGKNYEGAVNVLKDGTAADPGNADGWAMLGQGYLGVNNLGGAEEAFKKCLEIKPDHPTGKSGIDLIKKNRPAAAGATKP